MLELKTKKELGQIAFKLASGYSLVRNRGTTYMPADYETLATDVTPDPDRTIWIPLNRESVQRQAADQFGVLFSTDGELSSFDFMVAQYSRFVAEQSKTLLVRTPEGLRELRSDGQLHDTTGEFVANALQPMLLDDAVHKDRVFQAIADWVDSEEEAHSMLKHFSTALAPGWSAVKYVMLMGEGRNGKSVLLKMLQAVFGKANTSGVTRQHIAEESPTVTQLNGKLLNLVFDGKAEYVKDSGHEKSLIAGEEIQIRRLYESTPTTVQTNALFVEGLNREPKSTDKSLALQKRIVRYQFPNVYPLNHKFERIMLSPESLGAFLSLLLDHYVHEDNVAEDLAPSTKAMELQLEHMFINSLGLQFLKYKEETDPLGHENLLGMTMTDLAAEFAAWRIKENDMGNWAEPDVQALFVPIMHTDRKSIRVDGKPRKARVVSAFKVEALAFLDTLKGEEDVESADERILGELEEGPAAVPVRGGDHLDER